MTLNSLNDFQLLNPYSIESKLITEIKLLKSQLENLSKKLYFESQTKPEDQFLTEKEACSFLSRSKATLWRYRKSKLLPFVRLAGVGVRYRKSDLSNLLKQINHV